MLLGLDLTPRQAARVLEQALRQQAELELEPRNLPGNPLLRGRLVSRTTDVLRVELQDQSADSLAGLLGAFCDIRTVLSDELYLFGTCIVDIDDENVPRYLLLAVPQTLQVANRRRFERKALLGPAHVRLSGGALDVPQIGPILSISPTGLASRVVHVELDDRLLIGDDLMVAFGLPGHTDVFELPVTVCNKALARDKSYLDLGLEFNPARDDRKAWEALERLRSILCDADTHTANDTTMDGES